MKTPYEQLDDFIFYAMLELEHDSSAKRFIELRYDEMPRRFTDMGVWSVNEVRFDIFLEIYRYINRLDKIPEHRPGQTDANAIKHDIYWQTYKAWLKKYLME